jgi:hypothetical protein
MKTIYLHIGTHKTGTTSLQQSLIKNRNILKSSGYLYPKNGIHKKTPGHHLLAWSISHGDYHQIETTGKIIDLRKAWPCVLSEMAEASVDNYILSTESFCLLSEDQIRELRGFIHNYNVKVYICLRRQDLYLKSLYSERIKKGESKTFKHFIEDYRERCDYDKIIQRWGNVFGKDNISVQLYRKSSDQHALLFGFLNFIHTPESIFQHLKLLKRPMNTSLSHKLIRILRVFNVVFRDWLSLPRPLCISLYIQPLQNRRVHQLIDLIPDFLVGGPILTDTLSRSILAEYESTNAEIAQQYFPDLEGPLLD